MVARTDPRTDVVYLDHAATTPMRPVAVEAMHEWLGARFGNPSGAHIVAREARRAIDDARDVMAELLGADGSEVIFTSGGTEADNLAVLGSVAAGGVAVCSAVEHHAVLDPVERADGVVVPVTDAGVIDLAALEDVLTSTPSVRVVSVMAANNETGVIQPLDDVVALVRRLAPDAALHTDAVQSFAWLDPRSYRDVDLVSVSAHKFGGPQGVGCLVARRPVEPRQIGGGQERGLRGGTHNVAGIVAMAAAARECATARTATTARVRALRDRFVDAAVSAGTGVHETASAAGRDRVLPGHAHLCLEGLDSEVALLLLEREGVCASAASSCSSGAQQVSHVLEAMRVPAERARGSLRFSLGYTTTDDDVDHALAALARVAERLEPTA